jgi:hypothetical protein
LIETTMQRLLYFGIVLSATEAGHFWEGRGRPGEPTEELEMLQDLVGVRMIAGPGNFARLREQLDLPATVVVRVERACMEIEAEIATRYPDPHEALTIRMVNARLLMGADRFTTFAAQVGFPAPVIAEINRIAPAHDSTNDPHTSNAPASA